MVNRFTIQITFSKVASCFRDAMFLNWMTPGGWHSEDLSQNSHFICKRYTIVKTPTTAETPAISNSQGERKIIRDSGGLVRDPAEEIRDSRCSIEIAGVYCKYEIRTGLIHL